MGRLPHLFKRLRGWLEAQGVWGEVREKPEALYERREPAEYVIVLGRKG
jgi:hypothetical protein